jgi:ribosome-associated toxin RatA of RatAB toxin-antitoxin module
MSKIQHEALLSFSAEQMYNLVNDVTAYPEFLPWCAATKILSQTDSEMLASLTIKKGVIEKTFTTKNQLVPLRTITMNLANGPFQHMQGLWTFTPLTDDACKVSFSLDFVFNNKLLALTLGPLFTNIANTMVDAFQKRAEQLYSIRPINGN